MEKNKDKKSGKPILGSLFFLLFGFGCGVIYIWYAQKFLTDASKLASFLTFIGLLIYMYVAFALQLILHEAGHLVFGLMTGYRFGSFRIFSFIWLRKDGKITFKRMNVAGTGGQCLMMPPDLVNGKVPYVFYNLGGALINLILSVLFLVLFILGKNTPYWSGICLVSFWTGLIVGLMNGLPMKMGLVNNDGHNAYEISKCVEAQEAFWVQMKVGEAYARGIGLSELPDEWFTMPDDAWMGNSIIATKAVFICNRQMEQKRFAEADENMAHILEIDSGMVGLHRNLLLMDRMYVEMITENRKEVVDHFLNQMTKNFMNAMKNIPSILRTRYALALLSDRDVAKAESIKKEMDESAKTYPYPREIELERSFMQMADECAQK
ncbi:MAG: M50 family metallopeptidase [Clostridiales bacterium]|nr:M50 family metallopeptidase [Candidatus Scatonaster coprocaballi]